MYIIGQCFYYLGKYLSNGFFRTEFKKVSRNSEKKERSFFYSITIVIIFLSEF